MVREADDLLVAVVDVVIQHGVGRVREGIVRGWWTGGREAERAPAAPR